MREEEGGPRIQMPGPIHNHSLLGESYVSAQCLGHCYPLLWGK